MFVRTIAIAPKAVMTSQQDMGGKTGDSLASVGLDEVVEPLKMFEAKVEGWFNVCRLLDHLTHIFQPLSFVQDLRQSSALRTIFRANGNAPRTH